MSDEKFDSEMENNSDATGQGLEKDITRRDVVKKAWVAPVVVAINLPNDVFAQSAVSAVAMPAPVAPPSAPVAVPPSATD